jgi:hypothetical protein
MSQYGYLGAALLYLFLALFTGAIAIAKYMVLGFGIEVVVFTIFSAACVVIAMIWAGIFKRLLGK